LTEDLFDLLSALRGIALGYCQVEVLTGPINVSVGHVAVRVYWLVTNFARLLLPLV
jgi:hypothetical protein